MKYGMKIKTKPEREEKQNGHKPPRHSHDTATKDLANLSNQEIENMSREDILSLQQTYGNRAVNQLLAQRQGEEEDEQDYPGPRSASAREASLEQQISSERNYSSAQRAAPAPSASGNVGDAVDLDGEAMYGWDRAISWRDVARVVEGVLPTQTSEDEEMPKIVIFSGTHGNEQGDLVNDSTSRGFVAEDQATAQIVNEGGYGIQVEVVDVVTTYRTMDELLAVYDMTDYIRILGWCYSKRSYGLGDLILSNWWPAPDNL